MSLTTETKRCPFVKLEACDENCMFYDEPTGRCDMSAGINGISGSLQVIEDTLSRIEDCIPQPIRKHIRG